MEDTERISDPAAFEQPSMRACNDGTPILERAEIGKTMAEMCSHSRTKNRTVRYERRRAINPI